MKAAMKARLGRNPFASSNRPELLHRAQSLEETVKPGLLARTIILGFKIFAFARATWRA
jgi:hypothetical protein